jgi:hypothetical protein
VLHTGYVDTAVLLEKYREYLVSNNLFVNESFDYELLEVIPGGIRYMRKHIFCRGFGMHANPYFKNLPLDGTKGELFIIKAPELNLDVIVNTSVFILPLGGDFSKGGYFGKIKRT